MARSVALAIDLGASGGRVVAGSFDGRLLELEEIHRFDNAPVAFGGQLVWDLVRLWQEVVTGLRMAAARHGRAVSSVGVDTWGVDFSFLGSDGGLLANPVCYRDSRTLGMLATAEQTVSRAEMFAATGLQFMEINSLFQLLAMQQANSSVLAAADRLLMIPDIVHWLLSGIPSNERTNASTSQCFDPQQGDWAFGMLERFGLPRGIFGPIIEPGTDLGPLRAEVAAETGLEGVRVVVPGTHDTASAVAAVPASEPPSSRPDWCYVSLGTWALVGAELDRPLVTEACRARNFTNEGGIGGTTRLLKNVCGLWLVQQCRAAWQRAGKEWSWDQLTSLAAEAPALTTLIDPNHPSLVAPTDMPEAIRSLARTTGEPVPESTAAVVRTALESVAGAIARTLEELDGLLGRRVGRVHVVGGGVKNRMLCQMIADATDRPVIAGPVEATAIGNLLVQLLSRDGTIDLRGVRNVVRDTFEITRFEPQDAPRWKARLAARK
ncbi:MAG: rhamnulokinase [Planctomycetota bacterium]|nr:MAG: rhamnulokinase [Planctomycetota bacterium]